MGNQFVLPAWNESTNNKLEQWTKYKIMSVYLFVETISKRFLIRVSDKLTYLKYGAKQKMISLL